MIKRKTCFGYAIITFVYGFISNYFQLGVTDIYHAAALVFLLLGVGLEDKKGE